MQIPLIFRQPGRIPAGKTADQLVSNYDFLPSVLSYVGLAERTPRQPPLPGRDFSPVLRGEAIEWDHAVFYEMETCRAIRTDQWKLVLRHPSGPHELYNMQADPRERFNLYGQTGTEMVRDDLSQRLSAFFKKYADPQYDLWQTGRSKARRLTGG